MSLELPPVGQPQNVSPPARTPGSPASAGASQLAAPVQVDVSIPSSPPAQLQAEMAAANARVDELARQGRELHFSTERETGRIIVEVRDLDGNLIRTIPPSKALDVAAGGPLDL